MKGDINNSRMLTPDIRPYSAGVSVTSQDYLITTMKMRDQILASRSKKQNPSCKLIRNMRSAPQFQNRNLDNYPMPHNKEDAVRSARGQRAEKRYSAVRTTKYRTESGLMRDYSKQMFDFSVKSANQPSNANKGNNDVENRIPLRSKSEADYYDVLRTNGPTPDGSVLHNRRQKVLNSIRLRPQTECQTRFKHERATSSGNVQSAICDKNRRYMVRSISESPVRPESRYGNVSLAGSEFIFIPVDQSSQVNGWMAEERLNSRHLTVGGSLSESNETDSLEATFGRDPFDDFDEPYNGNHHTNNHSRDTSTPSTCTPYSRSLLPPTVSSSMRLVSLDEPSSSESEEEKEVPEVEVKKPEPPPPPPPQPKSRARGKKSGKKSAKSAKQAAAKVVIEEEEKSKVPEPEPIPEPVKVKLILKGPHCWVDDATITSEPSDNEDADCPDGGNPISGEKNDVNTDKQNSASKLDTSSKLKSLMKGAITANAKPALNSLLKQPNQQDMKDAFDKALLNTMQSQPNAIDNCDINNKPNPDTNGMNTEQTDANNDTHTEHEDEVVLPPFLCPSSEKKSREAALKDWLAASCFRSPYKGVPVV